MGSDIRSPDETVAPRQVAPLLVDGSGQPPAGVELGQGCS